jgi:hypothetical protein
VKNFVSLLWGCEKFVHSWLNTFTAEKEEKEFTRRYMEGYVCCLLFSLSSFIQPIQLIQPIQPIQPIQLYPALSHSNSKKLSLRRKLENQ